MKKEDRGPLRNGLAIDVEKSLKKIEGRTRRTLFLLVIFLIIFFSLFNTFYLTIKTSNMERIDKVSVRAIDGQINVCVDVPPPILSPIGDLTARTLYLFTYKVNATSPSNRSVYFYDNIGFFEIDRMTGWINFTPQSSDVGNHTVRISATHEICDFLDYEDITMIIISNHAPIWLNNTPTNQAMLEDKLYTFNLSGYVTDPDNDTITFSSNASSDFPSFNLSSTGILNFTPDDIDVGVHAVKIYASDGQNETPKVFMFTVVNVNEPPILIPFPTRFDECENIPFHYRINATDEDLNIPNGTEKLFFYDNTPIFVINENTGDIAFTPEQEDAGHHNVRIYVTDEEEIDYQNTDFHVIPVNDAPRMNRITARTVWINETLDFLVIVSDEEDGGNDNGNLNFTDDTDLFDINSTNGRILFIPNDTQKGTYNINICATYKGISIPENASLCGNDYNPKTDCEIFSLTVTDENRPPKIDSYSPTQLVWTINETDYIFFSITKSDPDGTTPTTYWFVNELDMNISLDEYNFTTDYGDAGFYTIEVVITDGLLNDSVQWNVTVLAPVVSNETNETPRGGGGGGGACNGTWSCTDWFDCANFSEMVLNLSVRSTESWRDIWVKGCSEKNIPLEFCGLQIRYCKDVSNCTFASNGPVEYMACILVPKPSCNDGVRNCHRGACELLIDCGGPCTPCPGEVSPRLEYPTMSNCGDKRCAINEIFTCANDCYLFWLLCLFAFAIAITMVYIVLRRKIKIAVRKIIIREHEKISKIKENILEVEHMIQDGESRKARELYRKTEKLVMSVKGSERISLKRKLLKLHRQLFGLDRYAKKD